MLNIQPKTAVQTEQKAIDLLKSLPNYKSCKDEAGKCECGETQGLTAYDKNYEPLAYVLICDGCGNDDNTKDEVLNLY